MRLIPALLIYLSGCVTPYQRQGFAGGYVDRKLGPGEYQIQVNGNGFTGQWTLEGHFHRRARELCTLEGFQSYESNVNTKRVTEPSTFRAEREYGGGFRVTEQPGYTKTSLRGLVVCHSPKAAPASVAAPEVDPQTKCLAETLDKQERCRAVANEQASDEIGRFCDSMFMERTSECMKISVTSEAP